MLKRTDNETEKNSKPTLKAPLRLKIIEADGTESSVAVATFGSFATLWDMLVAKMKSGEAIKESELLKDPNIAPEVEDFIQYMRLKPDGERQWLRRAPRD